MSRKKTFVYIGYSIQSNSTIDATREDIPEKTTTECYLENNFA